MGKSPPIQKIIREEWEKRKEKNVHYSLRAFAKALKISPSYLSMLLSGKREFTEGQIYKICDYLGIQASECERLALELKLSQTDCPSATKFYRNRLEELARQKNENPFSQIPDEKLSLFSRWYHPAIKELWDATQGKVTAAKIALRLKIPLMEAEIALTQLKEMGLLGQLPKWATSGKAKSKTVRYYHKAILEKAGQAILTQDTEKREFSSVTLLMDAKKVPDAKKLYHEFRQSLSELLVGGESDTLYSMNFQLFSLEEGTGRPLPS